MTMFFQAQVSILAPMMAFNPPSPTPSDQPIEPAELKAIESGSDVSKTEAPGQTPAPAASEGAPTQSETQTQSNEGTESSSPSHFPDEQFAPLPAPPSPVDPAKIEHGTWRGKMWLRFGGKIVWAFGGKVPAAPKIEAVGGFGEFGYRVNEWLGISASLSHEPHEVAKVRELSYDGEWHVVRVIGSFFTYGLSARLYYPLEGRIQPWARLGGALVVFDRARALDTELGGEILGGVGSDFWVGRRITLVPEFDYRAVWVANEVGHIGQVSGSVAFHW